jgi:hypothetical protein
MKTILPVLAHACLFLSTASAALQDIPAWHFVPPKDSGVINVRDYGAKGDGVTDDTEAINRAISENIDVSRYRSNPFIWFPNGTYLVSGPIEGRRVTEAVAQGREWSAGWRAMMLLIGESRDGVIIQLKDHAPGYQDPAKKKWLIATGSESDKNDNFAGGGNRAFRHSIMNMTVDVGRGNPGAVAIDFLANNRGTVSHVTLRAPEGSGHTGLGLTRSWPGPAFIFDLKIEGFDYGITMDHFQYGMTFENIHLRGQKILGISNRQNVLAMRRVLFEGSVPFYQSGHSHGTIALLDSTLTGTGTEEQAAISSGGFVKLRRVKVDGFGTIIEDTRKEGKNLPASGSPTVIASYDQGFTLNNNGGPAVPLDLPIEDIPVIRAPDGAAWVDGGKTGESLQAAIDSGAEYIYITPATPVVLSKPIILRGKVRLIQGLSGHLQAPAGQPSVIVENGDVPVVVMHQMSMGGVDQRSNRTFALIHGDLGSYGVKATGKGKTHVVDVIGRGYDISTGHRLWARQLNAEFGPDPLFTNNGGDSWILGFKMETSPAGSKDAPKSTPSLRNRSGKLEVLGGLLYTLGDRREHAPLVPAFTNERGRLAVSYRTNGRPETYYKTILRTGGFEQGKDLPASEIKGVGAALLTDQR